MHTTMYFALLVPALVIASIGPAVAATLPDTGIEICQVGTGGDVAPSIITSVARDGGPYPRQDCRYGADPAAAAGALAKTGAGAKGFDYSKIGNIGTVLAAGAALGANPNDWACTRDNNTGLTWEVKTATAGLRFSGHTYTWFSSNTGTNGGLAGTIDAYPAGDTCGTTVVLGCYSQGYRVAVNAATLCGANDWRMPTLRELLTLSHFAANNPAIDVTYFPNTAGSNYWSDSTYAPNNTGAWFIDVAGASDSNLKSLHMHVRLVRGSPF